MISTTITQAVYMDIDFQSDVLVQKIKHLMITTNGRTSKKAGMEEFYQAFCQVLREEIMINWTASLDTAEENKARHLYFLSMEYLPGRFLKNNIMNIGANDVVQEVLKKMGRNFEDLIYCEPDGGLGNGGLGRLSSCILDSLATFHYPARGYGLRYQYGIFEQELWQGKQMERPDCWLLNTNPWESRRDTLSTNVRFRGRPVPAVNQFGEEVYLLEDAEEVRALPYDTPIVGYSETNDFSVLTLRLWSTKESPRNFQLQRYNAGFLESAVENTSLTDVLYPNDNTELGKRVRLKQEFLLVSASLHDILRRHARMHGTMSNFGDKVRIQINDTHPALAIAEIVRALTTNYDFTWEKAWLACQECCGYTNHTVLREGLEEWNEHRVAEFLPRQHKVIQKLNSILCDQVRKKYPGDEERVRRMSIIEAGQIRMANLAIFGSHKVNGVAKLHTEILQKDLFKDFYEMFPERFLNVTNGVTQRRWLLDANPNLANFISERIGRSWVSNFSELSKLHAFADDPESQHEFLQIKRENKRKLLQFLREENAVRDVNGKMLHHTCEVDENALFDIQIKRLHEYKRQLLNALHVVMMMFEIKEGKRHTTVPRLVLFGGKAAPGYLRAKQIIQFICAIQRKIQEEPLFRKHLSVVYVENYNVTRAEIIIPAADLSEQISTAGWEASGTGNMKLSMNGALTIGTEDGANIEMHAEVTDPWWPFKFGASSTDNLKPYKSGDIYIHDEQLRHVVDSLKDGTFSKNDEEAANFAQIHQELVGRDFFRVLQDFRSYYEAQKKVDALYLDPNKWAQFAIHNIASMGKFSVDTAVRSYAEQIWNISPLPPEREILNKVREEYSEHDRCRIGPQK